MSVKKSDVVITHRTVDNPLVAGVKDHYIEASVILSNRYRLTGQLLEFSEDNEEILQIKKQLIASLMYHIYADLIGPVNEMAILAQHHLTGMNDADELRELKQKLDDIIKGN